MYYGWKIIAALFVLLVVTSGLGFYNHAIIVQALATQKGFPIPVASAAVSVFFVSSGVGGLWIAALLDKRDVRLVICCGALVAALCLALLGQVETRLQLFILYAVFGCGFAASGLLPATTLVARWFHLRRARALSVATTGLSVGGILVTPASAVVVDKLGLVNASPLMGMAYFIGCVPLTLYVLRSYPSDLGLEADGAVSADGSTVMGGASFALAVRNRFFWRLTLAYVFVMLAQVGGIAHQYGLVAERLPVSQAAFAMGIMPLFSIVGRLLGGVIIDRYDPYRFAIIMILLQASSLAIMGYFANLFGLVIGLAMFGLAVGNLLMLQPLLLAEFYGLRHYSRIYSLSNFLSMAGVAAGPVLLGYLFAASGTYSLSYIAAGSSGLFACVIFVLGPYAPISGRVSSNGAVTDTADKG